MNIAPIQNGSVAGTRQLSGDVDSISSDFETFLKLLTAQISNQDPMDPMKSEQFAVQLATFSGVEQQVRTNELLEEIVNGSAGDTTASFSNWIGREVRAKMPGVFDGAPITLDPEVPLSGDTHTLVVEDSSGAEVGRLNIDGSGAPIVWNGDVNGGVKLPVGSYLFSIESFEGEKLIARDVVPVYNQVNEVQFSDKGPVLVFPGNTHVPVDLVSAVREEV